MTDSNFLENSLIIAAHPDDELLWFSSILKDVSEVIVVYGGFWAQPDLETYRQWAIDAYPRDNVTLLGLEESGVSGCSNWSNPAIDAHGMALTYVAALRDVKRRMLRAANAITPFNFNHAPESVASAYRRNYERLYETLAPRLHQGMNVFTHNPWGEYGHEEHVQLFRVLETLRGQIGFKLWISNYCTERALPLARYYFAKEPGSYIRRTVDKDFAEQVADVYRKSGCWTWTDNWSWFEDEYFMEAPAPNASKEEQRHLFPLNFFTIDQVEQNSKWIGKAAGISLLSVGAGIALSEAI